MAQNHNRNRRILFVLIILLLVSISYLALQAASYWGGSWQLVSGSGNATPRPGGSEPFSIQPPGRSDYPAENFGAVRGGRLFFKPRQAEETAAVPGKDRETVPAEPPIPPPASPQIPPEEPAKPEPIALPEPPKPTCPYFVSGILWGDSSVAILVHRETKKGETVRVGTAIGNYTVKMIERDSVTIQSTEAEFKLELGGM